MSLSSGRSHAFTRRHRSNKQPVLPHRCPRRDLSPAGSPPTLHRTPPVPSRPHTMSRCPRAAVLGARGGGRRWRSSSPTLPPTLLRASRCDPPPQAAHRPSPPPFGRNRSSLTPFGRASPLPRSGGGGWPTWGSLDGSGQGSWGSVVQIRLAEDQIWGLAGLDGSGEEEKPTRAGGHGRIAPSSTRMTGLTAPWSRIGEDPTTCGALSG